MTDEELDAIEARLRDVGAEEEPFTDGDGWHDKTARVLAESLRLVRRLKARASLPVVENCGSCFGAAYRETDAGPEHICFYTDEHERKIESHTEPPPDWCPIRRKETP